jgi:hypothetical protein
MRWVGLAGTTRILGARARIQGRPVVASPSLTVEERAALGDWRWEGAVYRWIIAPESLESQRTAGAKTRVAALRDAQWLAAHPVSRYTDYTVSRMRSMLRCPAWALVADTSNAAADSLASLCNFR